MLILIELQYHNNIKKLCVHCLPPHFPWQWLFKASSRASSTNCGRELSIYKRAFANDRLLLSIIRDSCNRSEASNAHKLIDQQHLKSQPPCYGRPIGENKVHDYTDCPKSIDPCPVKDSIVANRVNPMLIIWILPWILMVFMTYKL